MIEKFLRDDAGAITIDWVALTAGGLLLGIALVYGIFQGGVLPLSESINGHLGTAVQVPAGVTAGPTDSFAGTGGI